MSEDNKKTLRQLSSENWEPSGSSVTLRDLSTGALQRIAAATELMAQDRRELIDDLEYYKKRCKNLTIEIQRLERKNRELNNYITRLKSN